MIHRGDICLVDLNDQVGSEQCGVRPAVVVQNETGNINSPTTIVCPLTSKQKRTSITHVVLTPKDAGIVKESIVLCEQVRVIDKARIIKKLGKIQNQRKIQDINHKLLVSIGIGE